MTSVTLIDNYDCFTFNLVHYLGALGAEVKVLRNDQASVEDVIAEEPDAIVLSPGPCTPHEAGICLDLIREASAEHPDLRRLPRPSGHRRSFWRRSRARAAARSRQDRRHFSSGRDRLPRPTQPVQGHALSFAGRAPRHSARPSSRSRPQTGDGLIMGLRHITRPDPWRAVPPRKHRLGTWPRSCCAIFSIWRRRSWNSGRASMRANNCRK